MSACVCFGCGGETRATWPNGIARSEGHGSFHHEEGEWTFWYDSGQRRECGSFDDGVRVGVWREWYKNGQRASEGRREPRPDRSASERDGPWRTWHGNGQLASEGSFQAGERVGDWSYWKENGSLDPKRSGRYENDRRVD